MPEYWCHQPEGLIHRRRLVQYLSIVIGAAFGGRCTTVGLHGRHLLFVKLVVQQALKALTRGDLLASQQRTLLLLFLAGHVAVALSGHAERARTASSALLGVASPREGAVTKPRTPDRITGVLFVPAVSA